MKIQKKQNKKNKVLILVAVILLSIIGYGLISYKFKFWPFIQNQFNAVTEEQKTAGQDIKKRSLNDASNKSEKESSGQKSKTLQGSDPSPEPTPSSNGKKPTVGVSITTTTVDKDSNTLYIRSLIQTISSSGRCTLSMHNISGQTYSNSVELQAGPSTSSCKGFNVPLSQLSPGKWTINIHYEDNNVTGDTEGEITI